MLRERSFGDLRGKAYADIDADIFDDSYAAPNGETQHQIIGRVNLAWRFVMETYQNMHGILVVMPHGLVLRELIKQHLIVDDAMSPLSDFQNTCITQVNGTDKKTILRFCDARHLSKGIKAGAAV